MLQSLQNTVRETISTQSAIQQALRSPSGLRVVWVIVEAEEDEAVYKKFLHPSSTVVQTSKDETGRKGYSNLEDIVLNIKGEEPRAHIMGIRDTDYTRYEDGYETPDNIFLTDRRDLEMMMLDAESVKQMLHTWAPAFDAAFAKCVPICRHFGYLRIYNSLNRLFVTFHNYLKTVTYWDDSIHDLKEDWEKESTVKFVSLAQKDCSTDAFTEFVATLSLEEEDFLDICRGHDFIPILSKALIRNHIFSEANILIKMTESYSLDDFKTTRLYSSIKTWQTAEGVVALVE